jgi:hypothetical protein
MSMQFSLGKGLLRAAMLLGFLGCLIAQCSLLSRAATSEPLTVPTETVANASGLTPGDSRCANLSLRAVDALGLNGSDSMATVLVEIGMPDEFGVAVEDEDSIEMVRFNAQKRAFRVDRTLIGAKAAPKIAWNTRPSISPPLLV